MVNKNYYRIKLTRRCDKKKLSSNLKILENLYHFLFIFYIVSLNKTKIYTSNTDENEITVYRDP